MQGPLCCLACLRTARYAGYGVAKALVAYGGCPAPPGVARYLASPLLALFEGVMLPLCCPVGAYNPSRLRACNPAASR